MSARTVKALAGWMIENPDVRATTDMLAGRHGGSLELALIGPAEARSSHGLLAVNDVVVRTPDEAYCYVVKPDGSLNDVSRGTP